MDIIEVAVSQIGITQASNRHKKYTDYVGLGPTAPWCHAFISWCADQAGIKASMFPMTASTTAGMNWFKNKGQFKLKGSYTPQRGDVVYFKTGASHVGLVEKVSGGKITTIEGNSGSGQVVGRYTYSLSYGTITGYGTGDFLSTSSSGGDDYDVPRAMALLKQTLAKIEEQKEKEPELYPRQVKFDTNFT